LVILGIRFLLHFINDFNAYSVDQKSLYLYNKVSLFSVAFTLLLFMEEDNFVRRILNIGSCNLDDVYAVPHFVQAGETLASLGVHHYPGGKGLNQSVALAKAGAEVYHAGRIGPDGTLLKETLAHSGVRLDYLDCTAEETGRAIIQVNSAGQNCILLSPGGNHAIGPAFIDHALAAFGTGDVLLVQNETSSVAYAMEAAHARGMRIAFNPSPITPELLNYPLHLVSWFLLNEIEGCALSGETEPGKILSKLRSMYPNATIVQTIGADGVICHDCVSEYAQGIYKVSAVDTTAAGDTFTGFFLSAAIAGKPTSEALRLASMASALAVSHQGAAVSIPSLDDVLNATLTLA
jgi:ribokinase